MLHTIYCYKLIVRMEQTPYENDDIGSDDFARKRTVTPVCPLMPQNLDNEQLIERVKAE
jgi:hypothetical protein